MIGIHSSTRTFSYFIPARPAFSKKKSYILFSASQLSLGNGLWESSCTEMGSKRSRVSKTVIVLVANMYGLLSIHQENAIRPLGYYFICLQNKHLKEVPSVFPF